MNRYYILLLITLLYSCKKESEYLQVTNFYAENPKSPKTAIRVNNLGEVYYCIERNPEFEFPGEEKFIFDYYKSNKKTNWQMIKKAFTKSYLNSIHEKFDDVSHPSISLSYKFGDTLGVLEDFSYLKLNDREENFIYGLIDLIDTTNAKRINYYPFNIESLARPMPTPPKEEQE